MKTTVKTTNELKIQAENIFQGIRAIDRYTSLMRSMDNSIYELACSYDAIDANHPKAAAMKQTITDLVNISELLLEGFGKHSDKLEEMADQLSMDLLG